ncbi:hypothetical protein [Sphingomicrobium astaxanthinifaciens]|uniref:hypothetical protein n=1 Tax=Sphingomicrobium astaxanthinifaciens TaxID=1227949 RepID=UPI001FCB2FE3|nr:hypothetical protein [Sphingomicrobium astaxanthinifaciens]MCJ7421980.1 hypothetical protein [Sphingomicrobium astaxanthinifaciens]
MFAPTLLMLLAAEPAPLPVAVLFQSEPVTVIAARPLRSFEHDGMTYRYQVTDEAAGRRIEGERVDDGLRFELLARPNGRVRGFVNDRPVMYRAR